MTLTAQDVVTDALRLTRIVSIGETPRADYASNALRRLNQMLRSWKSRNVDVLHETDFSLTDEFRFWVPPLTIDSTVIDALDYQGAWNASTNTPSLTTGAGTKGHVYKVSVAGSTTLDDLTSHQQHDFIVYNGTSWKRGKDSRQFELACIALLSMRIAANYGRKLDPHVAQEADEGWHQISAAYFQPKTRGLFDTALARMPSNRYYDWY